MRFSRLRARVFGPLRGVELELDPRVALVFGPNESGKTSFRAALDTVLFGFEPARRESHPLYQWDEEGGDLHLEADVVFDGGASLATGRASLERGRRIAVERVLQATGKCRIAPMGEAFEGTRGSNVPLAEVADTGRDLFRTVYSLDVDDLVSLRDAVQARVDHLLLPPSPPDLVRPVRAVLAELRAEHTRLWRGDERGKTRAKELRRLLAEARREARQAAEHEESLRAALEERAALERESLELRTRAERLAAEEREAPFLKRLFELDFRRRASPGEVDLSELEGPLADPRQLFEEVQELERRMDPLRARLAAEPEELSPLESALLARRREIEAALELRGEYGALTRALEERRPIVADLEERRRADLRALLRPDAPPGAEERVAELPGEALRAQKELWESRRRPEERPPFPLVAGPWVLAGAALGTAFVALTLLDWVRDAFAGIGLALLVATLLAALRSAQRNGSARLRAPDELLQRLSATGVDLAFGESPAALERLIDGLARAAQRAGELAAQRQRGRRDEERLREVERIWSELAAAVGLDERGSAAVDALEHHHQAALVRLESVRRDELERAAAHEARTALAPALARKRAQFEQLERVLRRNVPKATDTALAYEEVQRRLQEERWLRAREDELRSDPLWEQLGADGRGRADADQADAPWQPAQVGERRAEAERIAERRSAADRRLGEIAQLISGDPGARPARARERVLALEAELEAVERQRDRLALLERILTRAERAYRDEHQPDVLRRASRYLERISRGRYTRLDCEEPPRGELVVYSEERGQSLPAAPPLSRGTRDQIHLCLRLGLLDHLDESRERLPLVLDEILVHWDTARRAALYPLLRDVSEVRQVILLTCHEHLAAEAEAMLGIQRLALPARAAGRQADVLSR